MKVKVFYENNFLFGCKYVSLAPFAPGTAREFTFHDITRYSREKAAKQISGGHVNEIEVWIYLQNKSKRWQSIYQFKLYLLNSRDLIKAKWWVKGLVYNDYNEEYKQGVIDILHLWSKGENIDWQALPAKSPLKENYIYCCLIYSRLSKKIIDRDIYLFDMSSIVEEEDFLYNAGLQFVGEKGYFGWSLYTFEDCLLEVFHDGGLAKQRKIRFLNTHKIVDKQFQNYYNDVVNILKRFNFLIEESY